MIKELDERGFEECVLSAPGREVVEFFSSSAAGPNEAMEVAAEETAGQTDFFRVDVDKAPDLAAKHAKGGAPCYVLFEDGVAISDASGILDANELERLTLVGEYGAD